MARTCKSLVFVPVFEVGSPSEWNENQQQVQVWGIQGEYQSQPKMMEMDTQEEKTMALTLAKNPTRLRPYPLKRRQAAFGADFRRFPDSSSTSDSLLWTCVGKMRLSVLCRTCPDARVTSSSVLDGFSVGGRAAMGGRGGERLPQKRSCRRRCWCCILSRLMRDD